MNTDIYIRCIDDQYYFIDETENYNGPYDTFEQAEIALKEYCKECL